jgi:hypothetical protein
MQGSGDGERKTGSSQPCCLRIYVELRLRRYENPPVLVTDEWCKRLHMSGSGGTYLSCACNNAMGNTELCHLRVSEDLMNSAESWNSINSHSKQGMGSRRMAIRILVINTNLAGVAY